MHVQTAVDTGILLEWTKGYSIPDTVGKDVVGLMNAALRKAGLQMEVPVLCNDTVSLLAASTYLYSRCRIAVIFGIKERNYKIVDDVASKEQYRLIAPDLEFDRVTGLQCVDFYLSLSLPLPIYMRVCVSACFKLVEPSTNSSLSGKSRQADVRDEFIHHIIMVMRFVPPQTCRIYPDQT